MQTQLDLAAALHAQAWALAPGALSSLSALAERGGLGASVRRPAAAAPRNISRNRTDSRTALIEVCGPIQQHRGLFESFGIGVSCDTIASQLRAALADPGITRVVLEFDTPGGSVFGISELAAEIRAARGIKPIIGIANSTAASAGYWLLSQCTEAYCAPSGQVGSIGVIAAHEDISGSLEIQGIRITTICAGTFKNEQSPFEPLSKTAKAEWQRQVDGYGADFTRDVAKGRNVPVESVRANMGQGRMLRPADALRAGMIDGVSTLDDLLANRARPATRNGAVAYRGLPPALARAMRQLDIAELS